MLFFSMDWLASHHVVLDCCAKTVTLAIPGMSLVVLQASVSRVLIGIISYIQAQRLISASCLAYLAHVYDVIVETPTVESVPVVYELPDVFLADYPGFPPE